MSRYVTRIPLNARSQSLFDLLTPVVKGWCTEQAIEIASTGVQIHGGMGFIEETGAAQYLRDARITSIYEGTTGIQANDLIGRKIAYEKGATVRALLAEMHNLDGELAQNSDSIINAIRASLTRALAMLKAATDALLASFAQDPKAAAAGAVPYLKMFGFVTGGWQMARAAVIAKRKLAAGEGDADFLRTKIATARFYADHILPMAEAHAHAVINGADSVMALTEAQF